MKKPIKTALSFLLITAFLAGAVSCAPRETKHSISWFDYFDTVITLTVYTEDRAVFDEMNKKTRECFERYHKLFDIYNEYDELVNLATVNRMAGEEIETDEEIVKLLELGKEYERLTEGALNIAMGAVLGLWHDARETALNDPENAYVPDADALKAASEHCNIEKLALNAEKKTVQLLDSEMRIDVGAIAKGYAADRAAEMLKGYGKPFLLNCGGAVLASGKKPDGTSFTAGILDPKGEGFVDTVEVSDAALSTSGSYIRTFSVGGREYGHIIDPDTLMPAEKLLSISVKLPIQAGACFADALSTACFILGAERAEAVIGSIPGAECVAVDIIGGIRHIG